MSTRSAWLFSSVVLALGLGGFFLLPHSPLRVAFLVLGLGGVLLRSLLYALRPGTGRGGVRFSLRMVWFGLLGTALGLSLVLVLPSWWKATGAALLFAVLIWFLDSYVRLHFFFAETKLQRALEARGAEEPCPGTGEGEDQAAAPAGPRARD